MKFAFGVYVITFPKILTVPFVAVALEVKVSPSISEAVKVIVVLPSSATVCVAIVAIVGAKLNLVV